jgi:hypothetical protein
MGKSRNRSIETTDILLDELDSSSDSKTHRCLSCLKQVMGSWFTVFLQHLGIVVHSVPRAFGPCFTHFPELIQLCTSILI